MHWGVQAVRPGSVAGGRDYAKKVNMCAILDGPPKGKSELRVMYSRPKVARIGPCCW